MNVVEIARDPEPVRAGQIRRLLDGVGRYWVPMTIDPLRVIDFEESGGTKDGAHGCISLGFLTDAKFLARIAHGSPTLGHVVDLTRGAAGTELSSDTARDTAR